MGNIDERDMIGKAAMIEQPRENKRQIYVGLKIECWARFNRAMITIHRQRNSLEHSTRFLYFSSLVFEGNKKFYNKFIFFIISKSFFRTSGKNSHLPSFSSLILWAWFLLIVSVKIVAKIFFGKSLHHSASTFLSDISCEIWSSSSVKNG